MSDQIRPQSLAHVALRTSPEQLQPMKQFYQHYLAADVRYENDFLALLSYDEEHHRVAIVALPGTTPKPKDAAGMAHAAFTFESLQDLAKFYETRKAQGLLPAMCLNHGPTTSMYYTDPDGNQCEAQVDNMELDDINRWMQGPEFAMNPIGTNFDPEELFARLAAGEDEEVLKKRVEIGPRSKIYE